MNDLYSLARGIPLAGTGLVGLMFGWQKAGELVTAADDRSVLAGFALYALGGAVLFLLIAAGLRCFVRDPSKPCETLAGNHERTLVRQEVLED